MVLAVCLMASLFCACDTQNENVYDTVAKPDSVKVDATYESQSSSLAENSSSQLVSKEQTSKEEATSSQNSSVVDKQEEISLSPPERDPDKLEWEQWYMVLANPDNEISKEYIENVPRATIDSSYSTNRSSSKYLDKRVVNAFVLMCKAAKKDGIKLYAISAYRSYSYQETLFKNRIDRVIKEEGLGREAATQKAATIVARPGTSEHHLGLAVDINSVETSFEKTKEFKWLQENAENYGFVMRYPKNKKSVTKIIYEPWHYRYVGVEHAKEMNRLGLCFEEYIEYLKNQR